MATKKEDKILRVYSKGGGESYFTDMKNCNIIKVDVLEGSEIKNLDAGLFRTGSSDPYCKAILMYDLPTWDGLGGGALRTTPVEKEDAPDREETRVIWDQPNPVWKARFEFVLSPLQKPSCIVFEVWDKDTYSADDFIGSNFLKLDWSKDLSTPIKGPGPEGLAIYDPHGTHAGFVDVKIMMHPDMCKVRRGGMFLWKPRKGLALSGLELFKTAVEKDEDESKA